MRPTLREVTVALGLLLLWAVVLGLPLLGTGFPVEGHDFWAHTTWGGHFARQFWAGDLYPRWLIDHNEGLGSPTFFFYPPLPFWLTALLAPLFPGESAPVSALAWVATAMLALSGWFTYLWLRTSVPATAAVFAAALYQVAPYHLLIDLYQRAAFAEFCAMTWFPLILLAADRASRGRGRWVLLLAVGTALLALTHVLSLLMFAPLVPAYAALAAQPGRRLNAVATTALGMILGLGLSGAYLVPALTLQQHVNMQVLWQGWGHYRQYLYDRELVLASGGHIFHLLLLMTLLGSIVLAALLWRLATSGPAGKAGTERADRRLAHFWMLVVLASAFLMTRASDPVWQLLPPLQRIQFPWRLATLITVALAALAAYAAASLKPVMALGRRSLVLAGVCIVSLWLMVTATNGLEILRQTPNPELNPRAQDAWEYKPRWVQAVDFQPAVRQSKGPDGRMPKATLDTGGRIEVVRWRPRAIGLRVETPRDSVLTVHQFYFPGWQAVLDGTTRLAVLPSQPHGLVTVPLPAGSHSVELRLRMTPNERNGWLLTVLSTIVCVVGLLWAGWRVPRRRRA
jgi:hypothetical protein